MLKSLRILLRSFALIVVLEFMLMGFLYLFRSMPNVQQDFVLRDLLRDVLITSPFLAFTIYVNYRLVKDINKRYPNKKDWKKRVAIESIIALLYAFIVIMIANIIFQNKSFGDFYHSILELPILFMVFFNIVLVLGGEAVFQFQNDHQQQLEIANLKKENILYQYQRLRDQINPHFLFNNLNVLVSLINIDSSRAEIFTKKLARVYRYVLTHDEADLVELTDELNFINAYIDLLKERFEEGLEIVLDIEPVDLQKRIIPLTLQALIENAIKHNIVAADRALKITIKSNGKRLVVTNNLQDRIKPSDNTGFGLKGIAERYFMLSGSRIDVKRSATHFEVSIPLITKNYNR